jgi:hypothetical protein
MSMRSMVGGLGTALAIGLFLACSSSSSDSRTASPDRSPPAPAAVASGSGSASASPTVASVPAAGAHSAPVEVALPPVGAIYPWQNGGSSPDGDVGLRLDGRFRQPPSGFTRVATTPGSFAAFLRTLPLLPEGAPVVDFRGNRLHDARHPNIAAVANLDVGDKDLQHCADAIIRLHAEWRYGKGDRDLVYNAVSGQPLSYRGYVAGDRAAVVGNNITMKRTAGPRTDDHALFRTWLDDVFNWAGTASLERDGKKVGSLSAIEAGDFFVMSGAPFGHAVLVLDVAKDDRGRLAVLLGQSYMPAQSFHILRPSEAPGGGAGGPWFVVEPSDPAVATPFWRPFPAASLRRFAGSSGEVPRR